MSWNDRRQKKSHRHHHPRQQQQSAIGEGLADPIPLGLAAVVAQRLLRRGRTMMPIMIIMANTNRFNGLRGVALVGVTVTVWTVPIISALLSSRRTKMHMTRRRRVAMIW